MRRIRRKAKVAWLPLYGNASQDETETYAYGAAGTLLARSDGQITWEAFPLTFDHQDTAYQAQNVAAAQYVTLRDIVEGNAYRLRRICGKVFVGAKPAFVLNENYSYGATEVAVGFILCRTDSAGDATTDFDEVNPLIQESAEDPWIWQRRWLLGMSQVPNDPQASLTLGGNIAAQFPSTNVNGYGSLSDGPHIDQKTARVISADERLMCVVACRQFAFGDGITNQVDAMLGYNVAVRLLGSMRTNVGNRRNASR